MPISVAGSNAAPRRQRGFTLIELMIVITIIALASAAVVLVLPDPRGRVIDEAETFAARAGAAHDMAVLEGRPISLWVSAAGYGFDRRSAGTWQPISEKPLRVTRWGSDIRPAVAADGGRDRVVFDPTGLADAPMDVALIRGYEAPVHVLIGADGSVRVNG